MQLAEGVSNRLLHTAYCLLFPIGGEQGGGFVGVLQGDFSDGFRPAEFTGDVPADFVEVLVRQVSIRVKLPDHFQEQ